VSRTSALSGAARSLGSPPATLRDTGGAERTSECRAGHGEPAGADIGYRGFDHRRRVQSVDRCADPQDPASRSPDRDEPLQQLAAPQHERAVDHLAIDRLPFERLQQRTREEEQSGAPARLGRAQRRGWVR
jgi:hypothetical protein